LAWPVYSPSGGSRRGALWLQLKESGADHDEYFLGVRARHQLEPDWQLL
jgi:hypothetical protein